MKINIINSLLCLHLALFLASCTNLNGPNPTGFNQEQNVRISSEADSKLPPLLYKLIASHKDASVIEKNGILNDVKTAIDSLLVKAQRDQAVYNTVKNHGNYVGFAEEIIIQIDQAYPLLVLEVDSNLRRATYAAIANANYAGITPAEKNNLLRLVKEVIDSHPILVDRNQAIEQAVPNNPAYAGWSDDINKAVDDEYPLLLRQSDLMVGPAPLAQTVYEAIASVNYPDASYAQKNILLYLIRDAINNNPLILVDRNQAIEQAVPNNPAYAGWSDDINKAVDDEYPLLLRQNDLMVGLTILPLTIYNKIANAIYPGTTHTQKNTLLRSVRDAINNNPLILVDRNQAIEQAIPNNPAYPGWSDGINKAVDDAYPLLLRQNDLMVGTDPIVLSVYNEIVDYSASTNLNEKNRLLRSVEQAINTKNILTERNQAIDEAVPNNPAYVGWADDINKIVDDEYPTAILRKDILIEGSPISELVYNTIIGPSSNTTYQGSDNIRKKNNLLQLVTQAIINSTVKGERNNKISEAVRQIYGNYYNQIDTIRYIVNSEYILLTPRELLYLSKDIYEAITKANYPGITNAQKNNVLDSVKKAVELFPSPSLERDNAIDLAVARNSDYPDWSKLIKDKVDLEYTFLISPEDSKLNESVYHYIAEINRRGITNLQRNNVLGLVLDAINNIHVKEDRDLAIEQAAKENGDYDNWSHLIKLQVNMQYPILLPRGAYGLSEKIYNTIAKANYEGISNSQKNEVLRVVSKAIQYRTYVLDERDKKIDLAVTNNGGYPGWSEAIKEVVYNEHPILLRAIDLNIASNVYNEIADRRGPSYIQKNKLLHLVKQAINDHKVRTERDKAIVDAVKQVDTNNEYFNWGDLIKNAVNAEYPLLISQSESGLSEAVYNTIINKNHRDILNDKNNSLLKLVTAASKKPYQNERNRRIDLAVRIHVGKEDSDIKFADDIKEAVNKEIFLNKFNSIIDAPLFLDDNHAPIAIDDVDKITEDDIKEINYILLPNNHWYSKAIINNPLKNLANEIDLTEPNIWGIGFEAIETANYVLLTKKEKLEKIQNTNPY